MKFCLRDRRTLSPFLPRLAGMVALMLSAAGCQQKMADQPSYQPLEPSTFFEDGQSARPRVPGTVARGHLQPDFAFFHGLTEETAANPTENPQIEQDTATANASKSAAGRFDEDRPFLTEIPMPVSESVLQHGYHRYMIYCVVCHDPLGTGQGRIVERGYSRPPSYHIQRLREAPVGRLFAVVSEGYGSMPAYASQISPEDRWAIVAYLRALQFSQHFPSDELTPDMRHAFAKSGEGRP